MSVRHLYLARHAEPGADGRLTSRGVEQATLLGRRLSGVPFTSFRHAPLVRTAETAQVVAQQLAHPVPVTASEAVGDYVPHLPAADEVDPRHRDGVMAFLAGVSPEDAARGTALAEEAVRLLTGPEPGDDDGHHLVVTHAFTIGWLVRHAYDAPRWRWVGIDSGHTALTVIRYAPGRPPVVAMIDDQSHLPDVPRV